VSTLQLFVFGLSCAAALWHWLHISDKDAQLESCRNRSEERLDLIEYLQDRLEGIDREEK